MKVTSTLSINVMRFFFFLKEGRETAEGQCGGDTVRCPLGVGTVGAGCACVSGLFGSLKP